MKSIEDIKVDLVNSKWLTFNNVDIKQDPMFELLSKLVKKDETVYSIVLGNILLTDKKEAKQSKKLAKLQMKLAKSNKPVTTEEDDEMDKIANDLSDPKEPGKAMVAITNKRIITIYQDLNKKYKLRKYIKSVDDIKELDAEKDSLNEDTFNFSINFGKVTINLVTNTDIDIKHFEFTLDQLIEIEAKEEIAKQVQKIN